MLRCSNKVIPPMIARWDALFLAAMFSIGSMLIEHSHRIDTAMADEAPALPASACADASEATPGTDADIGTQFFVSGADDDGVLPACE